MLKVKAPKMLERFPRIFSSGFVYVTILDSNMMQLNVCIFCVDVLIVQQNVFLKMILFYQSSMQRSYCWNNVVNKNIKFQLSLLREKREKMHILCILVDQNNVYCPLICSRVVHHLFREQKLY